MNQNIIYVLYGVLFLALFAFVFSVLRHLIVNQTISRKVKSFLQYTESETERRAELIREQERVEGELDRSKFDFLTKLDGLISQSNIKKYIPFLTAETYIIGLIVVSCVILLAFQQFSQIIFGFYIDIILVFGSFVIMLAMRNINYNRIESDIIDFMNLMENYSKTSSDIIDIFGKIYPFLTEPLRSMTQRCYVNGIKPGNVSQALSEFERGIYHKKFREIIHDLAVCSRYDTNYADIIEDSRKMLQEYLAGKEQKKAMLTAARIEYLTIAAVAALLFWMMGSFVGVDLRMMLLNSAVGNIIILYFVAAILIAVIGLFIMENGRD